MRLELHDAHIKFVFLLQSDGHELKSVASIKFKYGAACRPAKAGEILDRGQLTKFLIQAHFRASVHDYKEARNGFTKAIGQTWPFTPSG